MKDRFNYVVDKAREGLGLSEEEALFLLKNVALESEEFKILIDAADAVSKKGFNNFGEIHGQVGINNGPCSKNCKFCFFAEVNHDGSSTYQLTDKEIIDQTQVLKDMGVGSISLMSTADMKFEEYLRIGQLVRTEVEDALLFGNWGDLELKEAVALKEAGFTFYYHALRLREGIDTEITRRKRIETMKNVTKVGMLLGSCLEPIGPEHTYEEIVDTLGVMKDLDVRFMATMKRIATPNSCYTQVGEISNEEFAKLTAVTRLYFGKQLLTMAAHEPTELCLCAGANFLITEVGTNPRDDKEQTELGRGLSYKQCEAMLNAAGYQNYKGDFLTRYNEMQ